MDEQLRGCYGGGLKFEGNPSEDNNVLEMALLRHAKPALAPILDAALVPGGDTEA